MAGPNTTTTLGSLNERIEGDYGELEALSLDLSETDIQRIIGKRVEQSEKFWNDKLSLDTVRDSNETYWLNTALDESELYDFQVPYKNNRTFIAIETLLPMMLTKPPMPVVTPSKDTDASKELAHELQQVLLAKYEDLYVKAKLMMVARHLLIGYRLGVMKYRWDNSIGMLQDDGTRYGDVAIDTLRPQRVVLDEGASDPEDIPLIGEFQTATVEELVYKFPKKKDDIWRSLGVVRGTGSQMSRRVGYQEVWFTYYDRQNGEKKEALAWKMKTTVLGSMKNPNWNYDKPKKDDKGNLILNNFLDRPQKPYITFSFLNLGKYIIDDTSLTEQAKPMQDVLNKRGRQIVENADQANAGMVINSNMMNEETAGKLIGDPGEKAMVNGNVQEAAMRLPQNLLPAYVIEDKHDARDEIDNIYGTHDPLRGQASGRKTLGQDVLSQRSDLSRTQTLATSLEDGTQRLYRGVVQMMKVFYDEPQMISNTGNDGQTAFIQFFQDKIEVGTKVRVKSGSVLPDDPAAKEQKTIQTIAVIDPLTMAEGMNYEDPKKIAERIVYFRMFPDKYLTEILQVDPNGGNGQDPSAMQEDQVMATGKEVPPQQNPTKEHLATHQAFMESPQFKQLPPEIQQIIFAHVKAENDFAKQALGMQEAGTPTGEPNGSTPTEQLPASQSEGEQPTATTQSNPIINGIKGIGSAVKNLVK
jgi:hypothetical protein